MRNYILSASLLALVACGGGSKSGGHGTMPPPPPQIGSHGGSTGQPGSAGPKVEVSKDAKADYKAALASFMANDKGNWNESACRGAACDAGAAPRSKAPVGDVALNDGGPRITGSPSWTGAKRTLKMPIESAAKPISQARPRSARRRYGRR